MFLVPLIMTLCLILIIYPIEYDIKNKSKDEFIKTIEKNGKHADYHAIPSIPTNECFYPIDKAKELLKDMKINNINDNSRFILGSCNPILLVPGMYGSRLMINIKCKEFLQDKQKVFETRYFCGKKICQPSFFKEDEEEYVMWPALFDSPFKLYEDEENRKNSCFGYFMQYYNSPDECPKMDIKPDSTIDNEKYICRYHPAVKITYHGSTHKTESNSNCGLRGIENIVDSGKSYIKDQWVNQGSSVGFDGIRNRLQEMGYRAGFSLAGLPYDFRRFIHSNKEFSNNFKNLVESLYNNTGKKVIVIAHSFGALNSLNQLVEIQNTNLSSKIKRFVAIAPPFTGAPKAVQTITLGTRDFRTEIAGLIIDLHKYAQKLFSTTTPASYELMIKPHLDMLQEKTEYVKFTSAILERIKIERTCINETCENEYISKNSKYFNELFDFFPKLDEKLCSDDLTDPKHKELEEYTIRNSNNIRNLLPIYNKCKFRMFDYQNCPVVVYSDNHYKDIENFNSFCNNDKYSEKQYFVKNCLKRNKNNKNRCLLEFMMNEGSFGYENIDITGIYETREIHMKNIEKFYENQMKNDQISTFPNPGVPTTLVYSTFIQTPSAFLFEKNNSNFDFNSTNIHNYGGDGSVPSISVLFPGLKWAYEKGRDQSKHGIQFVEYCSLLNKDERYGYKRLDEIKNENEYIALGCDCLNDEKLNLDLIKSKKCSHSTMINDNILIGFLENIVSLEPKYDNISSYNNSTIDALNLHMKEAKNYEVDCNKLLHK